MIWCERYESWLDVRDMNRLKDVRDMNGGNRLKDLGNEWPSNKNVKTCRRLLNASVACFAWNEKPNIFEY